MQTNEIIQVNTIDQYNKLFGIETRHPLIGIVDLNRPEQLDSLQDEHRVLTPCSSKRKYAAN